MFRSYDHAKGSTLSRVPPRSPGVADYMDLWEVARATSSRPNYFAPMKIDGIRCKDGGFLYRNPSSEMLREVTDLNEANWSPIDCLVSVGCGIPDRDDTECVTAKRRWTTESRRAKQERQEKLAAYDCDTAHDMTWDVMHSHRKAYWRLDMRSDIWKLPLEDFIMSSKGSHFAGNERLDTDILIKLERCDLRQRISNCARRLVAKRSAQSRS